MAIVGRGRTADEGYGANAASARQARRGRMKGLIGVARSRAVTAVGALCLLTTLGVISPMRASAAGTFNVTSYGAVGDNSTDSTQAIRNAIADAQAAGPGSVVYFPTGHYVSNLNDTNPQAIMVGGSVPITLLGDGAGLSIISERQNAKDLFSIKTDGTTVNGLTLDTQSSNARTAIKVSANNTLLEHSEVLGGSRTFAIFYPGPPGAKKATGPFHTGNNVNDVKINDLFKLDGFSYSYQTNGVIQNIDHTGSRLALFVVRNTQVTNYTYHPGTQPSGKSGFWITPPSDNVTITNFVSDGSGGVLGANTFGFHSTNITIAGEVMRQGGNHISIGEVDGLVIDGCNYGPNSILRFNPQDRALNVVVKNCSSLPIVRFDQQSPIQVQAEFDADTLPSFTPPPGESNFTFQNDFHGPVDLVVKGGTFQNCSGGFNRGAGTFLMVQGTTGYPCSPDTPPTAALNVSPSSGQAPLNVTADASGSSDPDSTPITNYRFDFGDGTHTGPQTSPTATHTYMTAGTFTVTAIAVDSIGQPATATAQVNTNGATNLVGNPGFENDLSGWVRGPGTTLGRSTTAHSGTYSAQLTRTSATGRALLRDKPGWNQNTVAGSTCFVSAWVQAPSGIVSWIRTREYQGSTIVATHTSHVTGNAAWQQLSVSAPIVNGGDRLELAVYAQNLPVGPVFLVDDLSETCS